jgi:hypothetical protein
MVIKVRKVRRNEIELQDNCDHHDSEGGRNAGGKPFIRLGALFDLAADFDMVSSGQVQRIQSGLNGFQ